MKHITLFVIVAAMPTGLPSAVVPELEGPALREIVASQFPDGNVLIGGTIGWRQVNGPNGVLLDREFAYVTPENDFKQSTVHPRPGVWNWEPADGWVKRALEKGQVIRLHGPVSPQSSRWAKDDSRTPEELKANMEDFFTALCKRYNGHPAVKWMDVVNETVVPNGKWFGPKPGTDQWENPWTRLGFDEVEGLNPPSYIRRAFEIANQHAPDIKLVLNQHASMQQPMWDRIKATILHLRSLGLRVDGLGWQAHIDTGWEKEPGNVEAFHELIDWAHRHDLEFHVTEKNVWLKKESDTFEAQARTYGAVLEILLQHRDRGVVTWNTWNLSDGDAWIQNRKFRGCLFDEEYRPKPAYHTVRELLLNPPPALP